MGDRPRTKERDLGLPAGSVRALLPLALDSLIRAGAARRRSARRGRCYALILGISHEREGSVSDGVPLNQVSEGDLRMFLC